MEKMKTRYTTLCKKMTDFIVKAELVKSVVINCNFLHSTNKSCLEAVSKYKEFYQVYHLNELKIISITSY